MNNPLISFQAKHEVIELAPWQVAPRVIGVIGAKRSGKDTFAIALIEEGRKRGYHYTRLAFADKLYQEVAEAFGVSIEFLRRDDIKETPVPELSLTNCKDATFVKIATELLESDPQYAETGHTLKALSPRFCLQKWGTDYRRKQCSDSYWRDVILVHIKNHPNDRFVITDVRFIDEADMLVEQFEATTLRVTRNTVDQKMAELRAAGDPVACHPSETSLLNYVTDYIGDNVEGDFDAIRRVAVQFVS